MRLSYEKALLQLAVMIGGCVPVLAGLAGVILGPTMVLGSDASAGSIAFDSHFRYLSGLLLGIGLAYWSTVPRIEYRGPRFRVLTYVVFVGGLSRLVGVYVLGWPDRYMLFGLGMELIVTPLLALWQHRLARRAERRFATGSLK